MLHSSVLSIYIAQTTTTSEWLLSLCTRFSCRKARLPRSLPFRFTCKAPGRSTAAEPLPLWPRCCAVAMAAAAGTTTYGQPDLLLSAYTNSLECCTAGCIVIIMRDFVSTFNFPAIHSVQTSSKYPFSSVASISSQCGHRSIECSM